MLSFFGNFSGNFLGNLDFFTVHSYNKGYEIYESAEPL